MMKKIIAIIFSLIMALQGYAQVPTDNPMRSHTDSMVQKAALAFMKNTGKVALSVGVIDDGRGLSIQLWGDRARFGEITFIQYTL
jgi:hypothetical protein